MNYGTKDIRLAASMRYFVNNKEATLASLLPLLTLLGDYWYDRKVVVFRPSSAYDRIFRSYFGLWFFVLFRAWRFFLYVPREFKQTLYSHVFEMRFILNERRELQFILWRHDTVLAYPTSQLPVTDPALPIGTNAARALSRTPNPAQKTPEFIYVPLYLSTYGYPVPLSVFEYFGTIGSIINDYALLQLFPDSHYYKNELGAALVNAGYMFTWRGNGVTYEADLKTVSAPLKIIA